MLGALADLLNYCNGHGLKVRFAYGAVVADPEGYVMYVHDKWVPRLVNCPPGVKVTARPDDLDD
jgi:hypothetical protein